MSEFEKWFMDQEFYTNMRFIHGDALFTKDGDVYRVLPVLIAFESWFASACTSIDHIHRLQHEKANQKDEIDQLKTGKEKLELELSQTKQVLHNVIDIERSKVEKLKVEKAELEKRIAKTLNMLDGDLSYVEEDRRCNFDFLQMAMIRCLNDDMKALRGEHE